MLIIGIAFITYPQPLPQKGGAYKKIASSPALLGAGDKRG
jgi:hypothetical protein